MKCKEFIGHFKALLKDNPTATAVDFYKLYKAVST